MTVCADILGAPDASKEEIYGFVPGINEIEEQKHLCDRIKTIRQGLYQVMFAGGPGSGKHTLINALTHSESLGLGVQPENAVLTIIVFNEPDERVVIYKRELDFNGQPATEVMRDIPAFFQKYNNMGRNDGEKFLKIVDHVVMYLKCDGIAGSLIQIVDSNWFLPDAMASRFYLSNADAIVFLLNALLPFAQYEREYIARYFAGRQMQNLFFVINRGNLFLTGEKKEELKQCVREELTDVFTDQKGTFDEELFRRRVQKKSILCKCS